ncbi:MAG: hypothetical protein KY459_02670 [Acidobacteria bacterium]|nr:hypothetical protein [Acidobacteriota bacterium]
MDEDLGRHLDVLAEAADRKDRPYSRSGSLLDEKLDRHQTGSRQELTETRSMIKLSYTSPIERSPWKRRVHRGSKTG